jgi:hypothetical protein
MRQFPVILIAEQEAWELLQPHVVLPFTAPQKIIFRYLKTPEQFTWLISNGALHQLAETVFSSFSLCSVSSLC